MENEISWILSEKYAGIKTPEFEKDILRLKQGEPVAYIIGYADFLNTRIDLHEKPLIPRVETEYWVEREIKEMQKLKRPRQLNILDMFSGSGCIGIALLKNLGNVKVVFSEIDDSALRQIEKNLDINGFKNNYRSKVIKSDVFDEIHGTFDYIFANPPYIASRDTNTVQESVLKHEPKVALFASDDGLNLIKKVLESAPKFLSKEGILCMEIGSPQKSSIKKFIEESMPNAYSNIEFLNDQYDRVRLIKAQI